MASKRAQVIQRLLSAKAASQLSFNALSRILGVTNVYAAQLFYNQAQLKSLTAAKLKGAFGDAISDDDLKFMQEPPMRCWDDDVVKEPSVYRTIEATQHSAESLKMIINEKFGDGIMSAIDFYVTVEKVIGAHGEDRVVLTFNGKFLPFAEQRVALMTPPGEAASTDLPPSPPSPPFVPKVARALPYYQCPKTAFALRGAEKQAFVRDLLALKSNVGLSVDDIANKLGVTNVYAAQLLHNQARLTPDLADKLVQLLPDLTTDHTSIMAWPPTRGWDGEMMKEPNIYRILEGCKHHAYGIKAVINELFGDGIMSAIDFFMTVRRARGPHGEARVVITFNGKFLPHVEQSLDELAQMAFE